jgi:RHS repeat-associated protein
MINTDFTAIRTVSFTVFGRLAGVILMSVWLFANSQAQTTSPTDGSTPLGLAPGAPAGSYALSGFDNVNLYNGNLNFRLPLAHINGRGSAGYTMMLPIEKRWTVTKDIIGQDVYYFPEDTWWSDDIKPGYGPGVMHIRYGTFVKNTCNHGGGWIEYFNRFTLTRLTFTMPDGTEIEMIDQLTQGALRTNPACPTQAPSRGTVFISTDGTGATFISDITINDLIIYSSSVASSTVYGYLVLRDGTRYRIDNGVVTWMRDRNGNRLTFTYDGFRRVTSITDSLNRQVTIAYDVNDGAPYGVCDRITIKGFGGETRISRVSKTNLGSTLRSGYSLQTPGQLFGLNGSYTTPHDPPVISAVWLPDSDGVIRKYQFYYNSYTELARVVLPTGAACEYDWAPGLNNGTDGGVIDYGGVNKHIYRRVIERRVYADGTVLSQMETYSRPETAPGTTLGYVVVDQLDAGGALQARSTHFFHGIGAAASLNQGPTFFPSWEPGKEYQTDEFASDGATLLRRVAHTWEGPTIFGQGPHITQTTTTLADTNQVAKQTFSYDSYNNQTEIREYDFGSGAPPAYPTRHTHTDYLTSGYDTNTNIHLRSLPSQQLVYAVNPSTGAETLASQITYEYDLYDGSPNHSPLVDRPSISGLDSGFTTGYTTRGNVTKVRRWLDTPSSWIDIYAQYDIAGNVVKAIDGRGYATDFEFIDRFGSPNGESRANTAPPELDGQTSYAFPTKVTDALGQTTYTQYDYYLGRAVDGEDHNGVVSSGYYNDALDRPTQVIRANTASPTDPNRSQTTFTYNDASHLITTTSDRDAFGDNLLKSEIVYDGLGRTFEARTYAPGPAGCSSPCYSLVKTTFDSMGRTYQVSNPYWNHESPIWTTTQYDALSRVTSVTTPDGATVSTAYNGAQVTVTDQAGKKRRSQTDAFGRLTMVTEDPGGLNFDTVYLYDALGNLHKVTQGAQIRWFAYDSLSRLIRVKNPEQTGNNSLPAYTDPVTGGSGWAMAYSYDPNGNLTSRIDARNITTTINYDTINRSTSRSYTDGTPAVNYFYDAQALPAGAPSFDRGKSTGRLVAVTYGGGSQGNYYGYDSLGRVLRKFQQTGVTNYQTQATYNKAGAVTGETYPSGHTVNYTHDQVGRVSGFSGNLGGSSSTYADTISYNAAGQMIKERFGTNTSLYHNSHYNNRMQLVSTRVGDSATDDWNWSRGAITFHYGTTSAGNVDVFANDTDNNGNLRRQINWVPLAGGGYVIPQLDDYTYDALNRINSFSEWQVDSGGQLTPNVAAQNYSYDRFGNRQITSATGGVNNYNPVYDQTTNRINGLGYDAAGSITFDPLTGGTMTYDAENLMLTATNGGGGSYTYDADGKRVKRITGGQETWQVYGIGGELLAEYQLVSGTPTLKKEYGYRGGQMLVVWDGSETGDRQLKWLVQDYLGSTRMVVDRSGSLGGVRRHDFAPFGEELPAGVGIRSEGNGYSADTVRQKFGSKERDNETGLDYFGARYYSSTQGRFTTTDPLMASARTGNPQTWNRFVYVLNNPLRYIDPEGLQVKSPWDQLTAEERRILTSKLVSVKGKITAKDLSAAGKKFNDLFKGLSKEQISVGVTGFKNFIDNMGGHSNSKVWQGISSIEKFWLGDNNSVGIAFHAKNTENFLATLRSSKQFVVDGDIEKGNVHGNHIHSAREITRLTTESSLHLVQQEGYTTRFDVHWDRLSVVFMPTGNPVQDGLDVISAGLDHIVGTPISASELRQQLKQRHITPRKEP